MTWGHSSRPRVVAEEIGDRDKDTMHPLKRNVQISVASSLVKKWHISRNGPYIGGHLAFYFKLNCKQVYNVL